MLRWKVDGHQQLTRAAARARVRMRNLGGECGCLPGAKGVDGICDPEKHPAAHNCQRLGDARLVRVAVMAFAWMELPAPDLYRRGALVGEQESRSATLRTGPERCDPLGVDKRRRVVALAFHQR